MKTLLLNPDDLSSHIGIYADTGSGKSLTIKHYLLEVERRGEVAVVWDPDREYARAFRTVKRGDWILDPGVEECPYWAFEDEVRDEARPSPMRSVFSRTGQTSKTRIGTTRRDKSFLGCISITVPARRRWAIGWLTRRRSTNG